MALPLDLLQEEASDSVAAAVFTHFHVEIGEGRVVMEHEAAGCDNFTVQLRNELSDRFDAMRKDHIAVSAAPDDKAGNSELGDGVFLEKNHIGRDVAGEFEQHVRKQPIIALAFDESGPSGRKKLMEEIAGMASELRKDKEFEDRIAVRNLAAFNGSVANVHPIDVEEIGVRPAALVNSVIPNLMIRFRKEKRSQRKDRLKLDSVDVDRHGVALDFRGRVR
jgi:hypothetical protein